MTPEELQAVKDVAKNADRLLSFIATLDRAIEVGETCPTVTISFYDGEGLTMEVQNQQINRRCAAQVGLRASEFRQALLKILIDRKAEVELEYHQLSTTEAIAASHETKETATDTPVSE